MTKCSYKIDGIHCPSCEILIEEKLGKEKGIKKVSVDLAKKEMEVDSKEKINLRELNRIFKKNGYKFLEIDNEEIRKEEKWWWVPAVGIILIFLLLSKLGLGSFLNINSQSSLLTFFIFGIIAGFSSCGALLSGIIISYPKKTLEILIGRIVGYAILGTVLGMIGKTINIAGMANGLVIIVSLIMILVGLQMLQIKWALKIKTSLPKSIGKKIINKKLPAIIGLLTVFLPCGFTLLAESVAILSKNWIGGMLIMLVFVLGTSIPLFLMGLSSEKLIKNQKMMGLLILFFAIYTLNFQFGWVNVFSYPILNEIKNETVSNEKIEVIKASYTRFTGLNPYTIIVKKGQKTRLEIEVKENEYGCMSTIMLPGLFPRIQTLTAGKTLIMEFTPVKIGSYQFTCAMGVPHKGEVNVIE